jgi:hypothetical protein
MHCPSSSSSSCSSGACFQLLGVTSLGVCWATGGCITGVGAAMLVVLLEVFVRHECRSSQREKKK